MTKSTIFTIGSIMLLCVNVVLILFGIVYAGYGTLMPYHINFVGMTPAEIYAYNPQLMILAGLSIRLIGFLFISNGIVNTLIWYYSFRKEELWSWLSVLVSGALIIIPLLAITFMVAGIGFPFPLILVCLIVWAIGIGLTMREVFRADES